MPATPMPVATEDEMAQSFLASFPGPWTSEEARQPGGVLYALLFALGTSLQRQFSNLQFDWKACRLDTAVDEALDSFAKDFFAPVGDYPSDVERAPGEPDGSLRTRIKATLLQPAVTRTALINLLTKLTGEAPRAMEPWNPSDTAAWNGRSFFNVDTEVNSSRFGNPRLRNQGFIESKLPSFANQGDHPIWCFNKGAAWNAPSAYFFRAQATWWMQVARIDALINRTKPFGTKTWRRYLGSALTRDTLGGNLFMQGGETEYVVEVYPAFAGAFVVLARCNWNTAVSSTRIGTSKFRLVFSAPAPPGGKVDWLGTPITVGGVGSAGVIEGATQIAFGIQEVFQNHNLFVQPTWVTNYWLHSKSPTQAIVRCNVPAPRSASIAYQYFAPTQSGRVLVPAGATSIAAPISAKPPFQAVAIPTWNTSIDLDKAAESLFLTFGVPPAEDSFVYWGIHES